MTCCGLASCQTVQFQLAQCHRVQCIWALIAWIRRRRRMMSEEYEKAVEIGKKIADLQRQLDELKAQLPQPEPFKPKAPMRRYDPTEGFRMPLSAVKAMCDVVPDRMMADIVREQKAGLSAPSGFGEPPKPTPTKVVERG